MRVGSLRLHEENFRAGCHPVFCALLQCSARGCAFQRPGLRADCNVVRANGLHCLQLRHGDEIFATNRTTRLVFDVKSHYTEINGVQVALSFPVADQKGVALIAQFDLDTTVRPLLFPGRYITPKTIKTICLDPGHGGKDTGNRTFWHSEKTYTLALASELGDQLKKAGFNVILTRTKDTYVALPDRPALANRRGADLFVSLHFNATQIGRDQVEWPETYCITPVGASSTNARGEGSDHGSTIANRAGDKVCCSRIRSKSRSCKI